MRVVAYQHGGNPCSLIIKKHRDISTNVYIGTCVNAPFMKMTYWKDSGKYIIPIILHLSISNDNIGGLSALPLLTLVKEVWEIGSPMIRITSDVAYFFVLINLLLEVGRF
jgi:hypothetical protein